MAFDKVSVVCLARSSSHRRVREHFVHVDAVGRAVMREKRGAAHELLVAVELLLQLQRVRVSPANKRT